MSNAIKTIPMYQTSDGQTHTNRLSAELHDLGLKIRRELINAGFQDNGELKRICTEMAKKSDVYAELFYTGRKKIAQSRRTEKATK